MKILMVGAGATGGFYGALLARAGRDITFLLRPQRAHQVRDTGLEIVFYTGETLAVRPHVLTAEELAAQHRSFDVVILSTKAYQLAQAMEDCAPAVTDGTLLLPLLNGIRQHEILQQRFPAAHVLGGSVRIMSFLDERRRVVQMNELDQFNYGELSGKRTPQIEALHAVLSGAGFSANLQPDIVATLWHKWYVLASIGAVCTLARGTAGEVARTPGGSALTQAVVAECLHIAAANGYPPPEDLQATHLARMLDPSSTITSSMYRDMTGGAPVEVDHILGDLLARARGIAAPLLTAAYVQLKLYDERRAAAEARKAPGLVG